jgi:hypothetical protein
MQCALGWRMNHTHAGDFLLGPWMDVAICLLMLGCVQSSVMTLLNHIGVSTMGDYAYTVRASGSAGYMVAVIAMGSVANDELLVNQWHLYVGSIISVAHAGLALAAWLVLRAEDAELKKQEVAPKLTSSNESTKASQAHLRWEWTELLLIVWLVGICEMSYGLYAHEFMTQTFGSMGYFVFSIAVAVEIGLLLMMPSFPKFNRKLLFVGPLGWLLLFGGCLMTTTGMSMFGWFGIALALNCPFQISTTAHVHRMNPSVMGVASVTLAQSLGYVTATLIAAIATRIQAGPATLWIAVMPLSALALVLAIRKLARQNASFNVDDLRQTSSVSRGGAIASAQERADDFEGALGADHACADAQDIHVIVLDALASGVSVVAKAGPNSGELVRRHAHSNS